jgi:hypothetical protein
VSKMSIAWLCSEPNNTSVTVFTTVNCLSMFWAKCYVCYCVHISPLLDHIPSHMIHLLLCSLQSTTWPRSQPNDTYITVFDIVHQLTMFFAKWYP